MILSADSNLVPVLRQLAFLPIQDSRESLEVGPLFALRKNAAVFIAASFSAVFRCYVEAADWRVLPAVYLNRETRANCGFDKSINTKTEHSQLLGDSGGDGLVEAEAFLFGEFLSGCFDGNRQA